MLIQGTSENSLVVFPGLRWERLAIDTDRDLEKEKKKPPNFGCLSLPLIILSTRLTIQQVKVAFERDGSL